MNLGVAVLASSHQQLHGLVLGPRLSSQHTRNKTVSDS